MAELFQHPVLQALAWTLLHFLWQGAAIALMAGVLMKLTVGSASRYAIGVAALSGMLVAPVATFLVVGASPVVVESLNAASAVGAPIATEITAAAADLAASLPVPNVLLGSVVLAWIAGVMFFGLRLAGGWLIARRVTLEAVKPAADAIQRVAQEVASSIGLRRAITVLESSLVSVPVLIGWLKPVIILPTAALAALSPEQVEALIAHELAHVRRHDFLVNLLQSLVEAVLFYHPAVWWLSRRVRAERELCCDDVAVGVCDRLVYATALKDLAAMASPRLALAATDGDLLSRIRRVLGHGEVPESGGARWLPLLLAAIVIAVIVPAAFVVAAPPQPQQPAKGVARIEVSPEGQLVSEVAPEQMKATSGETQSDAAKRDVERLLRELEERLRQVQSPADLERLRHMIELQLAGVSGAREELVLRSRAEEIEHVRRALEDARVREDRGQSEELDRVRRQLEEARTSGNSERAREMERALRDVAVDRERDAVMFERQLRDARAALERSQSLAERGLMTQDDVRKLENLYHQQLSLKEQSALDDNVKRNFEERMKEVEADSRAQMQERFKRDLQAKMPSPEDIERMRVNRVPVDGPVQAGDLINITISGEPDFPTSYQVRADGTIRIPLLGSSKVIGLTSQQVQAAVGKLLSDRKLGSANQVKVAVFRLP